MGDGLRKATAKEWTREEIWEAVRGILVDSLGVDEQEVVPEASLVRDLGAESIDLLDIGFRVQQTFGVSLPTSEIRERIMIWRNRLLSELGRILEIRYGVVLPVEGMRQLTPLGIRVILKHLAEEQGVRVEEHDPVETAGELTKRLAKELEALGLEVSEEDEKAIIDLMLVDITSRQIVERIFRMVTVRFLTSAIAANLSAKAQEG